MKQKALNRFAAITLGSAAVLASSTAARADAISDAITEMGGLETAVGAGTAAVIAVALVFVGIKLGKRLLGKV